MFVSEIESASSPSLPLANSESNFRVLFTNLQVFTLMHINVSCIESIFLQFLLARECQSGSTWQWFRLESCHAARAAIA